MDTRQRYLLKGQCISTGVKICLIRPVSKHWHEKKNSSEWWLVNWDWVYHFPGVFFKTLLILQGVPKENWL